MGSQERKIQCGVTSIPAFTLSVSGPFMVLSGALMLEQGVQNSMALWSVGQRRIVCPLESKWWSLVIMVLYFGSGFAAPLK